MSSWFVICLSVLRLAACLAGLLHWFLFVVLIASNCAVFPDFLFGAWWSWRDLGLHDDLHLLNGGTLSLAHFPFWTRPMGTGAAPHGPGHQAGPPMPSQWNQGQWFGMSQPTMATTPTSCGSSPSSSRYGFGWHDAILSTSSSILGYPSEPRASSTFKQCTWLPNTSEAFALTNVRENNTKNSIY